MYVILIHLLHWRLEINVSELKASAYFLWQWSEREIVVATAFWYELIPKGSRMWFCRWISSHNCSRLTERSTLIYIYIYMVTVWRDNHSRSEESLKWYSWSKLVMWASCGESTQSFNIGVIERNWTITLALITQDCNCRPYEILSIKGFFVC